MYQHESKKLISDLFSLLNIIKSLSDGDVFQWQRAEKVF